MQDDITSQPNVVHSLVRDGRNIVALDFDSVADRVYWSDTSQDRIWSANNNGSDRTVVSYSLIHLTFLTEEAAVIHPDTKQPNCDIHLS